MGNIHLPVGKSIFLWGHLIFLLMKITFLWGKVIVLLGESIILWKPNLPVGITHSSWKPHLSVRNSSSLVEHSFLCCNCMFLWRNACFYGRTTLSYERNTTSFEWTLSFRENHLPVWGKCTFLCWNTSLMGCNAPSCVPINVSTELIHILVL